jgi:SLT domain-containing protein
VSDIADMLGEAWVEIRAKGTELASDISSELKKSAPQAAAAADEVGKSFGDKFKAVISAASKIGAAAFVAGLGYALKAGNDLEESQVALEQAVKNTGGTMQQYAPAVAAVQAKMEALGYANADVNSSVAKLTTATGSAKDAIGLEAAVADLAAAKHLSLADATSMVAKAAGGNTRALKDMNVTVATGADWAKATAAANAALGDQINSAGGIAAFAAQHHLSLANAQKLVGEAAHGSIPALNQLGVDVLPKTATSAQRTAELAAIMNQRIGGDAAAAAGTAEGKMKVLKAELTDMAAKVGEKLLPVIADLIGDLTRYHLLIPLVIAGVVLLTAAFVAEAAAMIAANWPILLIVGACALLVAGVVLLATHWRQVWTDVKNWARDAWDFIWNGFGKYLLPLLGPAGLIVLGVIEVWQHWSTIWGAIQGIAQDFYNWIWVDFALKIYDVFVNKMPSWFDTAAKAIGQAFNAVKDAVLTPVNWVIVNVLDNLIKAFDWISSKVGGPSISQIAAISAAKGARVPGYGGGDVHPALLEGGETVVSKEDSKVLAPAFAAVGVPGYAAGGIIPGAAAASGKAGVAPIVKTPSGDGGGLGGILGTVWHAVGDAASIVSALATGNSTALANTLSKAAGTGTGGAVGDLAQLLTAIPKTLIAESIKFLTGKAQAQASGYHGSYGAGVAQWRGTVLQALAMLGLPSNLANAVLYQMQTESGGNPNITNTTDINAQEGHPSTGLMQVIPSTFAAYHVAGTSNNINDPLANIAAAINYARSRYGPTLMSGGMGIGSGHGYALGGLITEPIFGVGASGQTYSFGEGGRQETVVPGMPGTKGGVTLAHVVARLDRLASLLQTAPAATGAHVGQAITGAVRTGAQRGAYGVR